jgi:hypothetical protein
MTQLPLFERIADLLDREHDALADVDTDTLATIEVERRFLLAALTPVAASERAAFDSLEQRRARNEQAAEAAVSRLGGALGRVGRGRTVLVGYSPIAGSTTLSRALDQEV